MRVYPSTKQVLAQPPAGVHCTCRCIFSFDQPHLCGLLAHSHNRSATGRIPATERQIDHYAEISQPSGPGAVQIRGPASRGEWKILDRIADRDLIDRLKQDDQVCLIDHLFLVVNP